MTTDSYIPPDETNKERRLRLIDERNAALQHARENPVIGLAKPNRFFYLCNEDGTRQSDDWYTVCPLFSCASGDVLAKRFHYPEEIVNVPPGTRIEYVPTPRPLPMPKVVA